MSLAKGDSIVWRLVLVAVMEENWWRKVGKERLEKEKLQNGVLLGIAFFNKYFGLFNYSLLVYLGNVDVYSYPNIFSHLAETQEKIFVSYIWWQYMKNIVEINENIAIANNEKFNCLFQKFHTYHCCTDAY